MEKKEPLISVIVPVYKAEPYLGRCVDSILAQTYRNLEILLVDDGSPDNCGMICDRYAVRDSRIKVIHQENGGISAARNAGLDICAGDYIAFVDSDDYIMPDMYKTMLASAVEHDADICVCQWQYQCTDGKQVVDIAKVDPELRGKLSAQEFFKFLFKGTYENVVVVAAWNKLYKRKIFSEHRFSGRYQEDDDIHTKIFSKNYSVVVIEPQFYVYCENITSLTHLSFRPDSLRILDIMAERAELFCRDAFIAYNAKLTYCNLYVEYYYKAKHAGIPMPKKTLLHTYIWDLICSKSCNLKFVVRMILFLISPKAYDVLLLLKKTT